MEEKFNYCHSSIRNVVERAFAVLKARWQTLEGVPLCGRDNQTKIIVACFALHKIVLDCDKAIRAHMNMHRRVDYPSKC